MTGNSTGNNQLLVDGDELARLCAKGESTIRNWLRAGIIERANPAAARGHKALFDLAECLPRILSYVAEKRELTDEEKAIAAAKLRILEAKAAQAELQLGEIRGRLHSTEDVLAVIGGQHVAFRQKMLGLPSKTARVLSTMSDVHEIQKLLTAEVREALAELAGWRQSDVAARRRARVKGNGAATV